jgi:hypothetical protein
MHRLNLWSQEADIVHNWHRFKARLRRRSTFSKFEKGMTRRDLPPWLYMTGLGRFHGTVAADKILVLVSGFSRVFSELCWNIVTCVGWQSQLKNYIRFQWTPLLSVETGPASTSSRTFFLPPCLSVHCSNHPWFQHVPVVSFGRLWPGRPGINVLLWCLEFVYVFRLVTLANDDRSLGSSASCSTVQYGKP